MTGDVAVVELPQAAFGERETTFARWRGFEATTFCYPSGVAGLRLANAVGHVDLLPFHGQQIWDAHFHGRRLTMRSVFDTPVATREYRANYGGFFLHCGATAMGNVGPDDVHPVHGELPNAPYQRAALVMGTDANGPYIGLTGTYRHAMAFAVNYEMTPELRLREASGLMELDVTVRNLRQEPMELMYLAHVNFLPVDGATILDTVPDSAIRPRKRQPPIDVASHRHVRAGERVIPEMVLGMTPRADAEGWAHALQMHDDGTGDVVSQRPDELPLGVRWITRTSDEDAFGFLLPATAEADGYTAEKAKGNVLSVPAGDAFACHLRFGALAADEAAKVRSAIEAVAAQP